MREALALRLDLKESRVAVSIYYIFIYAYYIRNRVIVPARGIRIFFYLSYISSLEHPPFLVQYFDLEPHSRRLFQPTRGWFLLAVFFFIVRGEKRIYKRFCVWLNNLRHHVAVQSIQSKHVPGV